MDARSESVGPGADEHDVGRMLHDGAGERDRVPGTRDVGDGSGEQRLAVHDGGVKLVGTVGGKDRAASGVEQRIVFEELDGRFDGVERGTAFIEDRGGCAEGLIDSGAVGGFGFGGHTGALDDSGSAVEDNGPLVWRWRRGGRGLSVLSNAGGGGKSESDKNAAQWVHGK
jgi:hypothetical protein